MKTRLTKHTWLAFLAVLTVLGTSTLTARAEPRHRNSFYWGSFRPGMTIGVLPPAYVQVAVGPTGYYYYNGVYFQPTSEGSYSVVTPPVGVIVPQLPDGAETVVVGDTTYYYGGGAFYLQQPNGFSVVQAPAGLTVTKLPPGATVGTINGTIYFVSGSTYFKPLKQGGVTVYVTAQP